MLDQIQRVGNNEPELSETTSAGDGQLGHCVCGHSGPPHTADSCHRCACRQFVECLRCENELRTAMHNLSRSNWRTRQAAELHTVIARINFEHAPLRDYLCRIDTDEVHCRCGEFFATFTHHAQHLADVVITESGLRQAMRSPAPAGPVETRWVTEWVAAS